MGPLSLFLTADWNKFMGITHTRAGLLPVFGVWRYGYARSSEDAEHDTGT
jgi:hypothetical protein